VFEFLLSEEKKMRRHAANWLEVAERVQNFRRDLLSTAQLQQLMTAAGELKLRLNEKADASRLKMAIEKLEDVLRTTGGRIYPTSSLVENVEFFLVAAIVILGLRAYFVQPFKIPTNSMWPSYYGMTHELFADGREPGWIERAGRLLAFGATHFAAEATADGEVYVPVVQTAGGDLHVPSSPVTARTAGIFPTVRREYVFSINGTPARIQVPGEFDFERVLEDAFAADGQTLSQALQARLRAMSKPPETSIMSVYQGSRRYEQRVSWLPVGKRVKRGEKIVSFDIHTGDLLFVDRFTYNFFPPSVGQGFVFKTGNIEELRSSEGDKYYIKRLVGVPGDKLQLLEPKYIRDGTADASAGPAPQLMRNGAPITGAEAFQANAERTGLYPGYANAGRLGVGRVVDVPDNSYFALGDNSPRSLDSRYWGFIPDKDVVGKPLFIYYPLSRRWGVAN
jgi:signal peptidase I